MSYKIVKHNVLSNKDIQILTLLIVNNWNKLVVFDQLYPDKVLWNKIQKHNHFRNLLENKKQLVSEFVDNYYKDKFKDLHLSKERILTDIMDTIDLAKRNGDIKNTLSGYKLLADLLGLHIVKGQIDINSTSLILHYHQPQVETDDQVVIKINDNDISK